jgi:ribosomal protein S18 acetylase RimI-like enzyme
LNIAVETITPRHAGAAGDVLTASHERYPAFRYLFPDPEVRRRVLGPFMTATARDAARQGHALGAFDGGALVGVALWMPPGTFPLSAARKARMAPALLRTMLAAGSAFWAFARAGSELENDHPPETAWYLEALGVHPRAQRRGVGSQLVTPVLAIADESGRPCHLHTSDPSNVDYYRRFGFEVSPPNIRIDEGLEYIGMTRAPARS